MDRVEQARKMIYASAPGSALLITDFRGMRYDKQRTDYALRFSKDIKPYVKKSALPGVEGLKKVIFQSLLIFPVGPACRRFPTRNRPLTG